MQKEQVTHYIGWSPEKLKEIVGSVCDGAYNNIKFGSGGIILEKKFREIKWQGKNVVELYEYVVNINDKNIEIPTRIILNDEDPIKIIEIIFQPGAKAFIIHSHDIEDIFKNTLYSRIKKRNLSQEQCREAVATALFVTIVSGIIGPIAQNYFSGSIMVKPSSSDNILPLREIVLKAQHNYLYGFTDLTIKHNQFDQSDTYITKEGDRIIIHVDFYSLKDRFKYIMELVNYVVGKRNPVLYRGSKFINGINLKKTVKNSTNVPLFLNMPLIQFYLEIMKMLAGEFYHHLKIRDGLTKELMDKKIGDPIMSVKKIDEGFLFTPL